MTTISRTPAAERLTLTGIGWETYERLLADHTNRSAPRFTYDHGTLEIMSPFAEHELYSRGVDRLVLALADEMDVEVAVLGSTTFRLTELDIGFEPDSCYYVQHEPEVRGKRRLDLDVDPPPDIVLEIDISRSSIPKLNIFEAFHVREVWRYDGERFEILLLSANGYNLIQRSAALPMLDAKTMNQLLAQAGECAPSEWRRQIRAWVDGLRQSGE